MMKQLLLKLILWYRTAVSPLFPPCCRFVPTCSQYAYEAISRFGWGGVLLSAWRLLRCHPFCKGGYDPVPEELTFRRKPKRGN